MCHTPGLPGLDTYGGSHGIREENLLASAVARAERKVSYDPVATSSSVDASLSYGPIKNHAFIDGNTRLGLAALAVFLALNGHVLAVSQSEQTARGSESTSRKMSGPRG